MIDEKPVYTPKAWPVTVLDKSARKVNTGYIILKLIYKNIISVCHTSFTIH